MIYFTVCLAISVIIALIYYKMLPDHDIPPLEGNKSYRDEEERDNKISSFQLKQLLKAVGVLVCILIVLCVQPYTVQRVDAGSVGIKVELVGDARGVGKYEYKTGWVMFNTWTSKLYEFPTYQQHVEYPEQAVITKGGFQCNIKPTFNYSLKSGDVGDMFSNLRLPIEQVEQKWLQSAIVGTVNDVANKWTIDSLFNNRQAFESDVIVSINKKVAAWFIISQVRTNILPPEALKQSIEAKTRAIQEVQVAENTKKVKIAEGLSRVAEAKADSAVQVTKAAGEARAIREKQLTLTPLYIQYVAVQTWDGKLPTTSLSGSTPFIYGK